MKFAHEILTQKLLDEVDPLLKKHWEEIAHYKDIPLSPAYDQYLKLQELGMLQCFSARDGDGVLIGYAVYLIRKNLHYQNSLWAQEDIIYIDPDRRGVGMFLIKWCDEELKKLGVQVVSHHIKFAHDWSSALERLGYEKQDMILTKRLDI